MKKIIIGIIAILLLTATTTYWKSFDGIKIQQLIFKGDTISHINDSIYYQGDQKWKLNGDTISNSIDTLISEIIHTDTIFLGNGDTISDSYWSPDANGIHYIDGKASVGISSGFGKFSAFTNTSSEFAIVGTSQNYTGIYGIGSVSGILGYTSSVGGIGVVGQGTNGIGVQGSGLNVGVDGVSNDSIGVRGYGGHAGLYGYSQNKYGIESWTYDGYSGYFHGGNGLLSDSIHVSGGQSVSGTFKVGSGATISKTGTMGEKYFWSGTQSQYDALGGTHGTDTIFFIQD